MSNRRWVAMLVFLSTLCASAANAAMCPRIVFDPQAFVKNTIVAESGLKQVALQVDHYIKQGLQYKTQLEQLKGVMDTGSTLPNNSASSLAAAGKLVTELSKFRQTAAQVRGAMTRRLDEAKAAGLDWEQYVQWQGKLLAERDAGVLKRVEEEMRLMHLAQREHAAVRSLTPQIKDTAGIHESMQQINNQINMWITQQAELARVMASAVASPADLSRVQMQTQERRQRILSQQERSSTATREGRQAESDVLRDLGK